MTKIRVLIAENDAHVAAAIADSLDTAPDLERAGTAADADSVVRLAGDLHPDVVLIEPPPLFLVAPGLAYASLVHALSIVNVSDLWPDSVVALGFMRDGPLVRAAYRFEAWAYGAAQMVGAATDARRYGDTSADSKKHRTKAMLFERTRDVAGESGLGPDPRGRKQRWRRCGDIRSGNRRR